MRNEKCFDTIVKSSLLLILKYLRDGNVVVILKDFSTPAHLIKYLCTLCRTKSSHSSIHGMEDRVSLSAYPKQGSRTFLFPSYSAKRSRRLKGNVNQILLRYSPPLSSPNPSRMTGESWWFLSRTHLPLASFPMILRLRPHRASAHGQTRFRPQDTRRGIVGVGH